MWSYIFTTIIFEWSSNFELLPWSCIFRTLLRFCATIILAWTMNTKSYYGVVFKDLGIFAYGLRIRITCESCNLRIRISYSRRRFCSRMVHAFDWHWQNHEKFSLKMYMRIYEMGVETMSIRCKNISKNCRVLIHVFLFCFFISISFTRLQAYSGSSCFNIIRKLLRLHLAG